MILIARNEDQRLIPELERFDVPVSSFPLDYGDACWSGSGPDDRTIVIGFEHKRLSDLITSMEDRRLIAQLRRMWQLARYDRVELVIEGVWRPTAGGSSRS